MRRFLAGLCLILPTAGLAAAASAEPVTFHIENHRDPHEVDEVTRVFVDGAEVGVFELGPGRDDASLTVTVEAAREHRYALCGRINIRHDDGSVILREVNGAGALSDVRDRHYEAIASHDFTVFFLRDVTRDRPATTLGAEPQRSCNPNVASR